MWAFDLTQFDSVWKVILDIGLLLIALLAGNAIRRTVPFLRKAFIPSALIGGLLLFLVRRQNTSSRHARRPCKRP